MGDEVLKQFAGELRSAGRATDVACRWGGDEFIVLLDCHLDEAEERTGGLHRWICGNYTVHGPAGELKLNIDASIGLAEWAPGEGLQSLRGAGRRGDVQAEGPGAGRRQTQRRRRRLKDRSYLKPLNICPISGLCPPLCRSCNPLLSFLLFNLEF